MHVHASIGAQMHTHACSHAHCPCVLPARPSIFPPAATAHPHPPHSLHANCSSMSAHARACTHTHAHTYRHVRTCAHTFAYTCTQRLAPLVLNPLSLCGAETPNCIRRLPRIAFWMHSQRPHCTAHPQGTHATGTHRMHLMHGTHRGGRRGGGECQVCCIRGSARFADSRDLV